jgi:hypothetical protein
MVCIEALKAGGVVAETGAVVVVLGSAVVETVLIVLVVVGALVVLVVVLVLVLVVPAELVRLQGFDLEESPSADRQPTASQLADPGNRAMYSYPPRNPPNP